MLHDPLAQGVRSLVEEDDVDPPVRRKIRQGHGKVQPEVAPGLSIGGVRQDGHVEVAVRTVIPPGPRAEDGEDRHPGEGRGQPADPFVPVWCRVAHFDKCLTRDRKREASRGVKREGAELEPRMERSVVPPDTAALSRLRSARRLGLVLSGGSSRCAFQVGVIETLAELGVRPAVCVAVSGGAWNAAAVAAGTERRLRHYWRAFTRMPHLAPGNILREQSPFRFNEMHRRTFGRYVGAERLRRPDAPPLWIGVTRLRDRRGAFFDARTFEDPLPLLLASNYVPPFYTHAPRIHGERYGDGGLNDNLPYAKAFEEGCDAVILVTIKGESEGHPYRNPRDTEHVIPAPFSDRVVTIRPRHLLPCSFTERRWPVLYQTIELGRLRAREVLLGETHPETGLRGNKGPMISLLTRILFTRVLAAGTTFRGTP